MGLRGVLSNRNPLTPAPMPAIVLVRQKRKETLTTRMSTGPVFPILKPAAKLLFALGIFAPWVSAQSFLKAPTTEIFAGYSYLRYDAKQFGFANQLNLNGANVEVWFHVYHELGITADFSGHFSSEMEALNFLAGPQYTHEWNGLRLYARGFIGKARARLSATGNSQIEPSSLGGAGGFGGGLDIPHGDNFFFRPVQADYLITGAFGAKTHDLRISTGIVYRFGKKPKNEPGL